MMTFWALVAFSSAMADVLFSYRRIEKYGGKIELNPAITWLSRRIDPLLAVFLCVMVPSWLLIGLCLLGNWETLLAALAGARLMLNWEQFASLRLEKIWDEILRRQNEANKS